MADNTRYMRSGPAQAYVSAAPCRAAPHLTLGAYKQQT